MLNLGNRLEQSLTVTAGEAGLNCVCFAEFLFTRSQCIDTAGLILTRGLQDISCLQEKFTGRAILLPETTSNLLLAIGLPYMLLSRG